MASPRSGRRATRSGRSTRSWPSSRAAARAGDKLKELIEKGLRESDAGITFKDDIEPWLGDEAGFFVSGLEQTGEPRRLPG